MIRDEKGRFTKDSAASLTPEERLLRRERIIESIISKKNYIGDLVEKSPKVYNVWRAIRFTKKGKQAGCCDEWKSFRTFFNDVYPTYCEGLVFRRKNDKLPHSRDNFMWVSLKEAGIMRQTSGLVVDGEFLTLEQIAKKYNKSLASIRNRYYKHKNYSVNEIIFGKKTKVFSKTPKDYRTTKTSIRAKASKMISSYKVKDFKKGLDLCDIDIDWMIENIMTKKCIYCGDDVNVGCDRIDNNKGHTKDNVVPCCFSCNVARGNNFSYEEMLELGKTIAVIKQNRIQNN